MEVQVDTSTLALETSNGVPTPLARHAGPRSVVHLSIWVFAAFQFLYMFTSTGRARTADEYNTFYVAESLVLRGSTAIPQAVQLHNFYGSFDLAGQPQAAYTPGQAVLCTPWYAFGHYVLSRLPGVPANMADLVCCFSTCWSSATFSALALALFFAILTSIGLSIRTSLLATVILGLATPVFGYSAWLFSEPLSTATFMGVALLLFWRPIEPISFRTAILAGLILGMATWIRPTNVLAIPVFAAAVLVRDRKRGWWCALVLCATAGAGVLALLSRNAHLFGNAFDFGYPKVTDGGISTDVRFDTPLWKGLYGFILSPGKSVLVFAPPLLLAVFGLKRLWKIERGVATVATLFPIVYLSFFVRYSSWEGGYCVGPRYLVPSIALACLGLGPALAAGSKLARRFVPILFGLGVLVQIVTLATSFLEDQAPRGHYYDATWHYQLAYSLRGQFHLFWKYLNAGQPSRLGLGWDRWFVFLHLAGVSTATLLVLVALILAGLGISVTGLLRQARIAA